MRKRFPLGLACLLALILAAAFSGAAPGDAAAPGGAPPAPIRTPQAGVMPGARQVAPLAGEVIVCIAVRDHTTDAPVAGAHVKLTSGSYVDLDTYTGASGEVCLMRSLGLYTAHMLSAPGGHVVVRNSLVGAYGSVAAMGEVEWLALPGGTTSVTFYTAPLLTTLKGTVWADLNHDNVRQPGEGLSGYQVYLYQSALRVRGAPSEGGGAYEMPVLAAGAYEVRVRSPYGAEVWLATVPLSVPAAPGAEIVVDLRLPASPTPTPTPGAPMVRLYGDVLHACSNVTGVRAQVSLYDAPYTVIATGQSGNTHLELSMPAQAGTYVLDMWPLQNPLPPYELCVPRWSQSPEGHVFSSSECVFELTGYEGSYGPFSFHYGVELLETPRPTATPTITPTPNQVQVHGVARDASGAPIAGAEAILSRLVGAEYVKKASGLTGADGVFRLFISPVPGTYRVTLVPLQGYRITQGALPPGVTGTVVDPTTLQFTLPAGVTILGPLSYTLGPALYPTVPPPPIALQGYLWADANGDGARQDDEGFAGVEVTASGMGVTATVTSGEAGYYAMRGLAEGDYTLTARDALGRLPTTMQPVTVGDDPLKPAELDWRWWRLWLAGVARQ